MPHIFGQLLNAQAENSIGTPASGGTPTGRLFVDTTIPAASILKYFNGTTWSVVGNNAFIAPTGLSFLSSTGTYNLAYAFWTAAANATVGATYTNNGVTYTVAATVTAGNLVILRGASAPTVAGTLTKASGTGDSTITFYSVQTPLSLEIEAVGGGGGGAGGSSTGGTGGNGGNTTFGTLIAANGGSGGSANSGGGGTGGSITLTAPAFGRAIAGGQGGPGCNQSTATLGGGIGASSPFGGNGAGGAAGLSAGSNAVTNSGSGGGGGSATSTNSGGGGGAGGSVRGTLPNPALIAATFAWAIGIAGTAGTAGTGDAGGAGGSGAIYLTEKWQ